MSDSHFEIRVNGVARSWRDVEKAAIDAGRYLFARDQGKSEILVVDHKGKRHWRVPSDIADPGWVEEPKR